jgi:hypothetical protein
MIPIRNRRDALRALDYVVRTRPDVVRCYLRERGLLPDASKAPDPMASLMAGWREAGRRLTGDHWRRWDRINARLDGWLAMMLSPDDKSFVRVCMVSGGRLLLDSERR